MIRVALTQRTAVAQTGEVRDCLDQRWASLLEASGMLCLPVPTALSRPDRHLAALAPNVVVLTGGEDLATTPGARDPTPARDALERRVIAWCRGHGVPLIGVCRGMQLLAVLAGAQLVPIEGHVARRHAVTVSDAPSMSDGQHDVNSFHRYAVAGGALPSALRAFAWDADGNIEGFADRRAPEYGVMWHPEREAGWMEWPARALTSLVREAVAAT